jgi:hypothetical protein
MTTVYEHLHNLIQDPLPYAHAIGLRLVVLAVICYMVYEFLCFLRLLLRLWREHDRRTH